MSTAGAALVAGALVVATASAAPPEGRAGDAGSGAIQLAPGAVREDVALFRSGVLAKDRAFAPAARAQAEARLRALERTTKPMGLASFGVEICRIAALADNAHTFCDGGTLAARLNNVPIELARLGDGWFVIGGKPECEALFGARLNAIDGHAIAAVLETLASLQAGPPGRRHLLAWPFLKSPEALHALGLTRAARAATYRFLARDGRPIERRLIGGATGSTEGWRWLVPPERTAWAYRDLGEWFRWRDAPELDAVVIQVRVNRDAPNQRIGEFLERAEQSRESLHRRHVVLDLRSDTGGDLLQTRDFVLGLPARVAAPGRIFALIGPGTFSAGIATAAYLKQAGGDRVTLVGEPPGDRLVFLAEGFFSAVTLPTSRLWVEPSVARHDYLHGCRDADDCFIGVAQPGRPNGSPPELATMIRSIPISVASLDPDIAAAWTIDAFTSGRDPALEAIAAITARAARP